MKTKSKFDTMRSHHEADSAAYKGQQRYGLFSYLGTIHGADDTFPDHEKLAIFHQDPEKNIRTSPLKTGKGKDVYFSSSPHVVDKFDDYKANREMVKAKPMLDMHAKAFTQSGNTKPLSVKYDYQMPGDGKVKKPPPKKNFLTNPAKKGSTYTKSTFGRFPEHIPDPYESAEDIHRAERQKQISKRISERPYSTC